MITFSEIIQYDTSAPAQNLILHGGGTLSADHAGELFRKMFGEEPEAYEARTRQPWEDMLLSHGVIWTEGPDVEVGMRGDALTADQAAKIDKYLSSRHPNDHATVTGRWFDPRTNVLLREETVYSGLGKQFHATPHFTTDVANTVKGRPNTLVNYDWRGRAGADSSMPKFADIADEWSIERRERRERIQENREKFEQSKYDHYGLPVVEFDGATYAVAAGDDQADRAAHQAAEEAYEEGVFHESFVQNYVDGEKLARDYADDYDYFREQAREEHVWSKWIELEEGQDEPTEEQYEEVEEKLQEQRQEEIESDPVGYLRDLGYEGSDLMKILRSYVDEDELVSDAVDADGRGQFLAGYDGSEQDLTDLVPEIFDLPQWLMDELGITYRYQEPIYFYRTN